MDLEGEVITIGFLDIFKKNSELAFMYDFDLLEDTSERIKAKQLAIQTCVSMIARTISQSEFRVKKDDKTLKDEMYYRLNVRPNKNMSAAHFWQTVIYKLIHDNECLIVQSDTDDLLIADDFDRREYGILADTFKTVTVKDYTFKRTFKMEDVIYIEYDNENLSKLMDGVYADYGELIGRLFDFQKYKNQIRASVDIENVNAKDPETQNKIQKFIDNVYESAKKKSFALFPQQKGFTYKEHSSGGQSGQSVEDINKITNGFLDQIAKALGIPPGLLHGEMADVEKQTRNFMTFCIDPLLEKIKDELNYKFISKKEFLNGKKLDIRRVTYSNMFDVATAVDKLRSAGVMNGNELREELGKEGIDDPILTEFFITKNYSEQGGDSQSGEEET